MRLVANLLVRVGQVEGPFLLGLLLELDFGEQLHVLFC